MSMRPVSIFFLFAFYTAVSVVQTVSQVINIENKIDINTTVDYNTIYLWRGYTFSDGSVIQPSAELSNSEISLALWYNFDLKKLNFSSAFNEFDVILSYSVEFENLRMDPNLHFYFYPLSEESVTGEITLNAEYYYKNFKLLTSHNIDFINYKSAYYGGAGAEYEIEMLRNTFFDCSINLGWANSKFNETYGGISKNAFNHFYGSAGLTFYPTENIYAKLRFEYSNLIDKDLREMHTGQPIINWGFSLGMEL